MVTSDDGSDAILMSKPVINIAIEGTKISSLNYMLLCLGFIVLD